MPAVPQRKQITQVTKDEEGQSSSFSLPVLSQTTSTDSSSDSEDDETSTTFSSASSANEEEKESPKQTAAPSSAPNLSGAQSQTTHTNVNRIIQLNPDLRFERPDNEYIPLPRVQNTSQVSSFLRCILNDRTHYPEGCYRMVDYFRAAVELFLQRVRLEYKQQVEMARRNGNSMTRFIWRNKGELAVYFACCCDMLKLLYDSLQPGPMKPLWSAFAQQLAPLLIVESHLPSTVLTEHTYHTKYMDWQKGGTRYVGEHSSANIRFPSAQERRLKIEAYLRSGTGYQMETGGVVDPPAGGRPGPSLPPATRPSPVSSRALPPSLTVVPPGTRMEVKTIPPPLSGGKPPPFIPPWGSAGGGRGEGPGPVRGGGSRALPRNPTPHPPAAPVAVKQMPDEMRHLFWLSALAHIKGGEAGACFPDERAAAMPGFVRVCEITRLPREICVLVDILAASSEGIQTVFERLGGMIILRRFVSVLVRERDERSLIHVIRQLVQFRGPSFWGIASQKAWRTNDTNKLTDDLTWLRGLTLIPIESRAAWGALVLVMEEKYIFKASREEMEETRKRSRANDPLAISTSPMTGGLHSTLSDNCDFQRWKLPRVNTLAAVRLPVELRAPPFSSDLEKDTIDFINTKKNYAMSMQEEWRARILAAVRSRHVDEDCVSIPLWYDPFQLLGITQLE
ncbi:unnamed protein product [Phytomonas sp. EM1]|nr:unnamed protein product [Phytomonas sp. EM1]|eukprot:CCW59927.1 unnamed protein product [Phytomonas sp. isolate EM1]